MKVLYDYQIFDQQRFGGISRYFFELMAQFGQGGAVDWRLPVRYSNNEYLKSIDPYKEAVLPKPPLKTYHSFLWGTEFRGKRLLYKIRNNIVPARLQNRETEKNRALSIQHLKEGDFDVFHPTYYDDYFLDHIGAKPFVLTVYDMIHQIFPEFLMYDRSDKNKALVQKASRIIAISESTKRDLVSIFGVDEKKVAVTHLAHSLATAAGIPPVTFTPALPDNYLLFVGNRSMYKNFLFFIQAFALLAEKVKDLSVVCTGPPFDEHERYFFEKLGIKEKLVHLYVDDARLAHLYQHAEAFVFPSMYEGFGLPVLEAFSCGCPVVCSNNSSLPEVGGDAAVYFEAKNMASLLQALQTVVYHPGVKQALREKGYERLAQFSWHQTARQTAEVYKEVLTG